MTPSGNASQRVSLFMFGYLFSQVFALDVTYPTSDTVYPKSDTKYDIYWSVARYVATA